MISTEPVSRRERQNGRFTVAGWCRGPLPAKVAALAAAAGIDWHQWDYGAAGIVFLVSSHPDVAHSEESVAVSLGVMHDESLRLLSSRDLLERRLISPCGAVSRQIRGRPLVLCLSRREPVFSIFRGVSAPAGLFYVRTTDCTLVADSVALLLQFDDMPSLEDTSVLHHLLYRNAPGRLSYVKGVEKLLGGHVALQRDGQWRIRQTERLEDRENRRKTSATSALSHAIGEQMEGLVALYAGSRGRESPPGILLSGGVDSTLVASMVKDSLPAGVPLSTMSYEVRAPSFAAERQYAEHAVALLEANHRFVEVPPTDYPDWLIEATVVVGQPISDEQDPCYLALAAAVANGPIRRWIGGLGVDTLLGNEDAKRLLQVERFAGVPCAAPFLALAAMLVRRAWPAKAYGMREVARLLNALDTRAGLRHPLNSPAFSDVDVIQRCFAADAIREVLEYREELLDLYRSSASLVERVHLIELTTRLPELEWSLARMFHAYDLEFCSPFLDDALVKAVLTIDPAIRYYADRRVRWLPKQLLEARLPSKAVGWPKRGGGFDQELRDWMRSGVLAELVQGMERPSFMSRAEFDQVCRHPTWLTWNLLTLELFKRHCLQRRSMRSHDGTR